jgi:hypothetical protein
MNTLSRGFKEVVDGLPELIGHRRFQDLEFAALQLGASISAIRTRQVEFTGLVSVNLHQFTQTAATAFEVVAEHDQFRLSLEPSVDGVPGIAAMEQLEWMFSADAEKLESGDLLPKSFMGGYEVRVAEVLRSLQNGLGIDDANRMPTDASSLFSNQQITVAEPRPSLR